MKLVTKFKLFAMGLTVASATGSVSAMPILKTAGPDEAGFLAAWQIGENIEPLQAVLSCPNTVAINVSQDPIADLIALPMLGLDGSDPFTSTDAASKTDLNALVASILGNDGVDNEEALAELADATDADSIYFLGTHGSGGGAAYGGAHAGLGGGMPIITTSHAKHNSTHGGGTVTPSFVVPTIISNDGDATSGGGGSTVPLPNGALAGIALLGTLGGAYKLRTKREVIA